VTYNEFVLRFHTENAAFDTSEGIELIDLIKTQLQMVLDKMRREDRLFGKIMDKNGNTIGTYRMVKR
jgi:hypothetical protein